MDSYISDFLLLHKALSLGASLGTTDVDDCMDPLELLNSLLSERDDNDSTPNPRADEKAHLRSCTSLACNPAEKAIYFSPKEVPLSGVYLEAMQLLVGERFAGIKLKFDDVDIGLIKMIWNPMLVTTSDLNEAQDIVRDLIADLKKSLEVSSKPDASGAQSPPILACSMNF